MTRTANELATESLRLLGLLEAQENASAEDAAHIIRVYRDKLAEWQFRDIAYWIEDEIPNECFSYVCRMIAEEIAPSFGKSAPMEMDENGSSVSMGVKGLRGIRRIIQRERSGLPTVGSFF